MADRALHRLNSSGGKFNGCVSESRLLLVRPKLLLCLGDFGLFVSRSLTPDPLLFFSGDAAFSAALFGSNTGGGVGGVDADGVVFFCREKKEGIEKEDRPNSNAGNLGLTTSRCRWFRSESLGAAGS